MGEVALSHFNEREITKFTHHETGIDEEGWSRRQSCLAVRYGEVRPLYASKRAGGGRTMQTIPGADICDQTGGILHKAPDSTATKTEWGRPGLRCCNADSGYKRNLLTNSAKLTKRKKHAIGNTTLESYEKKETVNICGGK